MTVQTPSGMPHHRYTSYVDTFPVGLPDRTWPDRVIRESPIW
jgi:2-isopropylmalate synthase